jgi:hypothetical protein
MHKVPQGLPVQPCALAVEPFILGADPSFMTVYAGEDQVQCLSYPGQLRVGDCHGLDGQGPVRAVVLADEPI